MENLDLTGFVDLKCPCGEPLQVGKLQDGRWAIGHIASACSPLVSCTDPDDKIALGNIMVGLIEKLREGTFTVEGYQEERNNAK